MKTRAKQRWFVGGTLALVTAGGLGLWYRHPDRGEVGTPKAASSATPVAARRIGATYTTASLFPRGLEQEYEMRESVRLATSAGQVIADMQFTGPLKLAALSSAPNTTVRGEFGGMLEIGAAGNGSLPPDANLSEAAHRPFFLSFAEDGSFLGATGDPTVPAAVARVWTAVGECLQLVRRGGDDRWETREKDATGTYVAEYQQVARDEVTKRKVQYEALVKGLSSYELDYSHIVFQVDSETKLETYELEEHSKANPGEGPIPPFHSVASLSLKRTRASSAADRMDQWLAQAGAAIPLQNVKQQQDMNARDRARIAGHSPADAFERLGILDGANITKEEQDRAGHAFVALTAMLRQNPDVLPMVRARLEKGINVEPMLAALRDASTPESQKLLAEMTMPTSPLSPDDRMEAARSLSRVSTPSIETVKALKELRKDPDVGIQANFGLGSALHRIKETDPIVAKDVRQTLTAQIESATTDDVKTVTLVAFGNAGDPQTLSTIKKFVTDPSPAVRASAAQALRRIPGAEVDGLLAGLAADPFTEVRYQAVDAIHERAASPVLATAVSVLALRETDYKVRAGAVNILADWLSAIPTIADTLRAVFAQDPNADLKNVAKNALASL